MGRLDALLMKILAPITILTAILSLAAHCSDGPIGDFRRVIVNDSGFRVDINFTNARDGFFRLAAGDSAVSEGTCSFNHALGTSCDFASDNPVTITFGDTLRLKQAFESNLVDERWIGANIPVGIEEGGTRFGYTRTSEGGKETYRYVIGQEDVEAAEPF